MNRDFLYYLLPLVFRLLTGIFFTIPFTTAYLSISDFGLIALITFFTGLADVLGGVSFAWVVGGEYLKIKNESKRNYFLLNSIFLSLGYKFIVLLFCLFLIWLSSFYFLINDFVYFLLAIATLFLNSFWVFLKTVIIYEKDHKKVFYVEIALIVMTFLSIYTSFHFFSEPVFSFFFSYLMISLGSFFTAVVIFSKRFDSYSFSRLSFIFSFSRVFSVGLHPLIKNILEYIVKQGDRVVISKFSSAYDLGLYYHSRQYEQYFNQVVNSLNNSFLSKYLAFFERSSGDSDIKKFLNVWLILYFIGGWGVIFFSRDFINLLTHNKFGDAAIFVQVWYLTSMLNFVSSPNLQGIFAAGRTKEFSKINEKIYFFYLPFMILFTYIFGVYGALFSAVLLAVAISFTRFYLASKSYGTCILSKTSLFCIVFYAIIFVVYNF